MSRHICRRLYQNWSKTTAEIADYHTNSGLSYKMRFYHELYNLSHDFTKLIKINFLSSSLRDSRCTIGDDVVDLFHYWKVRVDKRSTGEMAFRLICESRVFVITIQFNHVSVSARDSKFHLVHECTISQITQITTHGRSRLCTTYTDCRDGPCLKCCFPT